MELKTERLVLRDLRNEDLADLVEGANNINVSRFLALVPFPYSEESGKWFINHCQEEAEKNPRENYEFGIELTGENKLVGMVSLTSVKEFEQKAVLGCWLAEKYWRKGIMNEAIERVLDFAYNELGLNRIEAEAFVENTPSNSMIKKLGFKYEGTKRKSVRTKSTGEFHDSNVYSMLKEDWSARKK